MKTTQHTPGPWSIAYYGEPVKWLSIKYGAETIARVEAVDTPLDEEGKANAQFIVTACNSHYELLEALALAETTIERIAKRHGPFSSADGTLGVIRGAIAKAAIQSAQAKQ